MRKTINMSVILLALGVGFAACDRAGEERRSEAPPATTPETTAPQQQADAKMSNSDLENAVKAKLGADEQLRAADLNVDADANKNEVTISGTVQSQDHRNKAVELAKNAHSGVTVNDKIDVKPSS